MVADGESPLGSQRLWLPCMADLKGTEPQEGKTEGAAGAPLNKQGSWGEMEDWQEIRGREQRTDPATQRGQNGKLPGIRLVIKQYTL